MQRTPTKWASFLSISCASFFALMPTSGYCLFLDGKGHYAARGELNTNPGMQSDHGYYEAIEQSFLLEGEARLNDASSFFLDLRLFPNQRMGYMGDEARGEYCRNGEGSSCEGSHQNTSAPGYKAVYPYASEFFVRYAMDYCLLEVGRRGRDWGMGLLYDSGHGPFATQQSRFDGISCSINPQEHQSISVEAGYDKLAETGAYVKAPGTGDPTFQFGPNMRSDDIYQFYVSVVYDDLEEASALISKKIGFYASTMKSGPVEDGGSSTDLTWFDLFLNLHFGKLDLKNEFIFRLGKTADPNTSLLGGGLESNGDPSVNDLQAIGFAGSLNWTLAQDGTAPSSKNPLVKSAFTRQSLFLDFAYAPGSSDGYYSEDSSSDKPLSYRKRSNSAKAMAFHQNYKPALILFNAKPQTEDLRVDGAYDPSRVMNAQLYGLGYRYEDSSYGDFEGKLIYGALLETMPSDVSTHYGTLDPTAKKPIGYYGSDLGFEIDFKYTKHMSQSFDLGLALGALVAGNAWQTTSTKSSNNYLVQLMTGFRI